MNRATATFGWEGVRLTFPYDELLIDELKRQIPGRQRRYDPNTHIWTVTTAYAEDAASLLLDFFPDAEVVRPWERGYSHHQQYQEPPRPATAPGEDAYAKLFLLPSAPLPVVEVVYRQLAKLAHPDLKPEPEKTIATQQMQAINAAYGEIRRIRGVA